MKEVDSGWFAAWLSLLAADDLLRKAAASQPEEGRRLAAALGHSLGVGNELTGRAELIQAGLNGLQLALLEGAPVKAVEEKYHGFWLALIG